MSSRISAEELAEIRLRELKRRKIPVERRAAFVFLAKRFETPARKSDIREVHRDSGGNARAALLFFRERAFFSGREYPGCVLVCDPGDPAAKRWALTMIRKHRKRFVRNLLGGVDPQHREILGLLGKLGFHVDAIVLGGRTSVALRGLRLRYGDLRWNARKPGLALRAMRSESDVDATIRILSREFGRNPQFGWFVNRPEHLKREKRQYRKAIRRKERTHFVFSTPAGEVVGHFGFEIVPNSVFGTRTASLIFNFDRSIQRKGLAKYAYAHLLRRASALKITHFIGGTAQKPIMKLSRVMKRVPVSYSLRVAPAYFPRSHFRYS